MYDVITLGSATVDVFGVISKKYDKVSPGDKVLVNKLDFEVGGGGVNSAVAFSRMGLDTAFLGKVGCDHNGVKVLRELKKEGVDFLHLKASDDFTSFSFILNSSKEKDRIIYTYKGASDHLKTSEINWEGLKKTKWIYMATLLKDSFKTAEKVATFASENKINLMFNPSSYLAKKGKRGLSKILKNTTILVLNKQEGKLVIGTKSNDIKKILKDLQSLGPDMVVVTDGSKGAHVYDGEVIAHMKPYKTKVVSTAGAGDAFASGFLAGIIKKNYEHALELGMANAASVVQYYGAKNKLLKYSEAKGFIRKKKGKVVVKKNHI